MPLRSESGLGTVEYIGLTALVAALLAVAVAGAVSWDGGESRYLGSRLAIKIRCAARLPAPCWRDPLTEAYGRAVAGLVRAWATGADPQAGLVPVDPRRCRSASCAVAADARLTTSNRRITVFPRVTDRRRRDGTLLIYYFAFRPTIGWTRTERVATRADLDRFAGTPLVDTANPQLIPLESSWTLSREAEAATRSPLTTSRSGTP